MREVARIKVAGGRTVVVSVRPGGWCELAINHDVGVIGLSSDVMMRTVDAHQLIDALGEALTDAEARSAVEDGTNPGRESSPAPLPGGQGDTPAMPVSGQRGPGPRTGGHARPDAAAANGGKPGEFSGGVARSVSYRVGERGPVSFMPITQDMLDRMDAMAATAAAAGSRQSAERPVSRREGLCRAISRLLRAPLRLRRPRP